MAPNGQTLSHKTRSLFNSAPSFTQLLGDGTTHVQQSSKIKLELALSGSDGLGGGAGGGTTLDHFVGDRKYGARDFLQSRLK